MQTNISENIHSKIIKRQAVYISYMENPSPRQTRVVSHPTMLTSYITMVYPSKLRNQHWWVISNSTPDVIWISTILCVCACTYTCSVLQSEWGMVMQCMSSICLNRQIIFHSVTMYSFPHVVFIPFTATFQMESAWCQASCRSMPFSF